jgi:hypothetical protein
MFSDRRGEELVKILEETLEKVNRHVAVCRRRNSYLLVGSLIVSTIATLLAERPKVLI